MATVPSNLIPTRLTQLPTAPVGATAATSQMVIVYNGNTYQVNAGDIVSTTGVPTSRQVIAGTGMAGGGALASDVTLSIAPGGVGTVELAETGVSAGQYGSATTVPVFIVDVDGRITSVVEAPITVSGYVPTSREVIAGDGLEGGGALNDDVTLTVDLTDLIPESVFQSGSAGTSTEVSRADHRHPAVDLADDDEVNGLLGLASGGTARSIVADAGAIVWSGADGLYVGPVGLAGQVLVSSGTGEYTWGSALIMSDQPANVVYAGPASGPDAPTAFRALVNADIPSALSDKTVQFPAASSVRAERKLQWDDEVHTLKVGLLNGVNLQVGQEQHYYVTNQSGAAIPNGSAVYASGVTSGFIDVEKMRANGSVDGLYFIGIATQELAAAQEGYVTSFGYVHDINTTGSLQGETWAVGDILYVSPDTPGYLTNVKPESPNIVVVAAIITVVHATAGSIFVRPLAYLDLDGLSDVDVQGAANGDLLIYDTTTSKWTNAAQSTVTAGHATSLTGGLAGSIPYQTSEGVTAMLSAGTGVLVGGATPEYSAAPALTGTNFTGVPNSALANSSVTIGSTSVSLGATSLTLAGVTSITLTQDPTSALQGATKQYVDTQVTYALTVHDQCRAASTGNLSTVYDNGTAGVGATLTADTNRAFSTLDGVTGWSIGQRILIKDQTNAFENGIYELTALGELGVSPWVMTRAADFDVATPGEVAYNAYVFVQLGAVNAGDSFVMTTAGTITIGTTAIDWAQFSAGLTYTASTGLTLSDERAFSITDTAVTAASYGSASSVAGFTVNQQGQLTAAADVAIAISAAAVTSGTLAIARGGTNTTSTPTAGAVPYGTGSALGYTLAGTSGQVLTSGGTGTPTWSAQSSLSVGSATTATTATNVAGGSIGAVLYQSASGVTTNLGLGTDGQVLRAGATAPEWGNVDGGTF